MRDRARRSSNEQVAEIAAANDDFLIPFAGVDPWKGKMAAREARRLIRDHGAKSFKFHPAFRGFWPNDRMA